MPDVVEPEAHQNDRSYIRELNGPTFNSLRNNLSRQAVTRSTSKKLSKSRPGYGLLLELHALTQVTCSYVPLLLIHVSCAVTCPAIPEGGGGGEGGEQGEPGNKANISVKI